MEKLPTTNRKTGGSNPSGGTRLVRYKHTIKECTSLMYSLHARNVSTYQAETNLVENIGKTVRLRGVVLRVRKMAWGQFIVINLPRAAMQCVFSEDIKINIGDYIEAIGKIKPAKIKDKTVQPNTIELEVKELNVLHKCKETYPVDISKKVLDANLDTLLNHRPVTLRHPKQKVIFQLSDGICRGFRAALSANGFTEIHTPKLVSIGAEGGANIFSVPYFDKVAFLAQSPQLYKQICVGALGRVFEIGPVFRAEKHNTARHLNEYTSMDLEMGPIDSQEDIMALELEVLNYIFKELKTEYANEIHMLGAIVPDYVENVPVLSLAEAHEIANQELGIDYTKESDLSPEEELVLCQWSSKQHKSDFVFVTGFPTSKRPFYAMNNPQNETETFSFDLLFRGIEITTGGQRIHSYESQVEKMMSMGLNIDSFQPFLQALKFGIPPHGGFGLGLERLLMKLLGKENIRETTMFPRDSQRLIP